MVGERAGALARHGAAAVDCAMMSRAFVKEPDGDQVADDQPERVHSDLPNYITPAGLTRLARDIGRLEAECVELAEQEGLSANHRLRQCQRDLRYLRERLRRTIPTEVPQNPQRVQFGVTVTLADGNHAQYVFTLVGEDETDIEAGRISWASPIGRLLIHREVGDTFAWPRGDGFLEVEVVEISAMT